MAVSGLLGILLAQSLISSALAAVGCRQTSTGCAKKNVWRGSRATAARIGAGWPLMMSIRDFGLDPKICMPLITELG